MSTATTDPGPRDRVPVADGPIDHTGMYVMHAAFRRDLDDLVAAAARTPCSDASTWDALWSYWRFFAEALHHHHRAEDAHYWPALVEAIDRRGTSADHATVTAMQDEHAAIDPALRRCRRGFADVAARPTDLTVATLRHHLAELRRVVNQHIDHEERDALPLVSRVITPEEYAPVDRAVGRTYPLRMGVRLVPWAMHGLAPATEQRVLDAAGAPQRVLLRLGRGGFERRRRRAYRYLIG